jgi:hypothetical protein
MAATALALTGRDDDDGAIAVGTMALDRILVPSTGRLADGAGVAVGGRDKTGRGGGGGIALGVTFVVLVFGLLAIFFLYKLFLFLYLYFINMKPSVLISVNVGILLSYIFTLYCHTQIITYSQDLTDELQKRYDNIRKERMLHFTIGLLLAVIISLLFFSQSSGYSNMERTNIIVLMLLLLPLVVYKLMPKSDYMLKHSQTDQDYKDWFNIYSCMESKSTYGFLSGFTVSMLILSLLNVD